MILFQPTFFWMFLVTVLQKVTVAIGILKLHVKKRLKVLLSWDPMGVKWNFQTATHPTVIIIIIIQLTFFQDVSCDIPHKSWL